MSDNAANPNRLITREPLSGSHKVYERSARFSDLQVPFRLVTLTNGEEVRLYDTSGLTQIPQWILMSRLGFHHCGTVCDQRGDEHYAKAVQQSHGIMGLSLVPKPLSSPSLSAVLAVQKLARTLRSSIMQGEVSSHQKWSTSQFAKISLDKLELAEQSRNPERDARLKGKSWGRRFRDCNARIRAQ